MSAGRAPNGLGLAGKKLWGTVTDAFDLGEHELLVLLEACRTVDTLNELDAARKAEGSVIDSPHGKKAHPAVVEARQQRLVLSKLLTSLAIPAEVAE
jgi:hypothetical protein